jgi:hypothetical protein
MTAILRKWRQVSPAVRVSITTVAIGMYLYCTKQQHHITHELMIVLNGVGSLFGGAAIAESWRRKKSYDEYREFPQGTLHHII